MATNGKIVQGPSIWDLVLSLIEDKPVPFTGDQGESFQMIVETLHDHKDGECVAPASWYPDDVLSCDFLLGGRVPHAAMRVYIEYKVSPAFGFYALLDSRESNGLDDLTYAPNIWRKLMQLPES